VRAVDLNSDLGEGLPVAVDDAVLAIVTSANVACGGHAGDAASMRRTVASAKSLGVRVGAHPSYPDRERFGRVHVDMDGADLARSIAGQVARLVGIASALDVGVAYLKPHGALYNDAAHETATGNVVARTAEKLGLPLMALAGSPLAARADVHVIREGFLDRAYREDGSLVPRSEPGALLLEPEAVGRQALRLASEVDSLSLHSDTPGAVELLAAARRTLESAGFTIAAR
jgi:5-oxoprolinase (ATP-hydrolysing) subunit A